MLPPNFPHILSHPQRTFSAWSTSKRKRFKRQTYKLRLGHLHAKKYSRYKYYPVHQPKSAKNIYPRGPAPQIPFTSSQCEVTAAMCQKVPSFFHIGCQWKNENHTQSAAAQPPWKHQNMIFAKDILKHNLTTLKATARAPNASRKAAECKTRSAEVPPETSWAPPESPTWPQFDSP